MSKFTDYTALGAAPATNDKLLAADVSDTSANAAGTLKTLLISELFTSPTFITPTLGVASATSVNKVAITAPATSATLTILNGKTFTVNHSLTLAGTDSTTMTFPTTSATIARTDNAQSFSGDQSFSGNVIGTTSASTLRGFYFFQTNQTSDVTLTSTQSLRTYTNIGASGEVILTLPTGAAGSVWIFIVGAAQYLRIKAPSSNTITYNGTASATAGYIRSNTVGNAVMVLGTAANTYYAWPLGNSTFTVDA